LRFKGAAAFNHANDFDAAYWDRVFHQGSHPDYSALIEEQIRMLDRTFNAAGVNVSTMSGDVLDLYWKKINDIIMKAENALKTNPTVKINDVKINF
jgi:hypothetical protein